MGDYVLIAEDDIPSAALLQEILGLMGLTSRAVTSGDEALQWVRSDPPDLVVLDLKIPGLNGFQLCEAIKRDPETSLIPVLVVTGHTEKHYRVRALESGADDLLTKPVDRVEFQARVRSMVTAHARARSLVQFRQVLSALLGAMEVQDPTAHDHLARVADLAGNMGRHLGLPPQSHLRLEQAAWLHDIGKLALGISGAGGETTCAEDEACYRRHPEMGEQILRPIPAAAPILPLVRGHHERWDGSGFPDGLPGAEQSLELQILAIANAFDRMCRRAGGTATALAELDREVQAGRWNPTVAAALRTVVAAE